MYKVRVQESLVMLLATPCAWAVLLEGTVALPSKESHSGMMLPWVAWGGSPTHKHQRRGWQIMYITFTNIKLSMPTWSRWDLINTLSGPQLHGRRWKVTCRTHRSRLSARAHWYVSRGLSNSSTCYQLWLCSRNMTPYTFWYFNVWYLPAHD